MNKRLSAIAEMIVPGVGVVDVGTDHGYLPAALAASGYPGRLFASDLRSGPLDAARRTAALSGVSDRITFLLCDGLRLCPPDAVDTIVIAGMGGDTIVKILDEAEWCMDARYHLLLQPMTKPEVLRYWLVNNGFGIQTERLVEESGTLYQLLSVRFGGKTTLRDMELFTGKAPLCPDQAKYSRSLQLWERRLERAIAGMRQSGESARLPLYEQLMKQLKEMIREDENAV